MPIAAPQQVGVHPDQRRAVLGFDHTFDHTEDVGGDLGDDLGRHPHRGLVHRLSRGPAFSRYVGFIGG
jgi:hypothetical protein